MPLFLKFLLQFYSVMYIVLLLNINLRTTQFAIRVFKNNKVQRIYYV
jgi:hypothetical protein